MEGGLGREPEIDLSLLEQWQRKYGNERTPEQGGQPQGGQPQGGGFGGGFGGGSFGGNSGRGRSDPPMPQGTGIIQPRQEGDPAGGFLQPAQTFTGHTGYDETWDGEGNMTRTPTGGGEAIPQGPWVREEQMLARPDLQTLAPAPQMAVGQPMQRLQPNTNVQDANNRAQALRDFDNNKNRVFQEDQSRRSGQAIADKQLMAETRGTSPSYAQIDDTRRAAAAATQQRAAAMAAKRQSGG